MTSRGSKRKKRRSSKSRSSARKSPKQKPKKSSFAVKKSSSKDITPKQKSSPYRQYSRNDSKNDFNALQSYIRTSPKKLPFRRSRVGYASSNRFFQRSRMKTAGSDKKESCAAKWRSNSDDLIEKWKSYQEKYKTAKDLSGFLIYLNKAPAQFPPSIAGMIYKHFDAQHVFDPFAGWGDRCIAAMAAGINYTGADSNTSLKPAYKKMIKFYWPEATLKEYGSALSFENSVTPTIEPERKNQPSLAQKIDLYFEPCQDVPIDDIDFDLVFSSPPFWKNGKLVEKYPECEQNYETFMITCMFPMMKKFQEKQITTCLHIPDHMYKDLMKGFNPCDRPTNCQHTPKHTDKDKIEGLGACDKRIKFSSGKWGKSSKKPNNNIYCWTWTRYFENK
jgi:hypothetical protein